MLIREVDNIHSISYGPILNNISITYKDSDESASIESFSFSKYSRGNCYLSFIFSSAQQCLDLKTNLTALEYIQVPSSASENKAIIKFGIESRQSIYQLIDYLEQSDSNFQMIASEVRVLVRPYIDNQETNVEQLSTSRESLHVTMQ